jgi:hypothetical protein
LPSERINRPAAISKNNESAICDAIRIRPPASRAIARAPVRIAWDTGIRVA